MTIIAFGFGIIPGVVGLVFGILGIQRIDASGGTRSGRGMALAGAICGGVAIGLFFLWLILILVSTA